MHGHTQYVREQLLRVSGRAANDDAGATLRHIRMLLVNGLRNADDHLERLHRLSLVNEIDQQLNAAVWGKSRSSRVYKYY